MADNKRARIEELLRRREERMRQRSLTEQRILDRLLEANEEYKTRIEQVRLAPPGAAQESIRDAISEATRVGRLQSALDKEARARERRVQRMFEQQLAQEMSQAAVTSRLTALGRDPRIVGAALREAQVTPTFRLERSIQQTERMLELQRQRVMEAAAAFGRGEVDEATLTGRASVQETLMERLARERRALGIQRKLGLDIGTRFTQAYNVAGRISEEIRLGEVERAAIAGKYGTRADVTEKLNQVSTKLVDTFQELEKAFAEGSDKADELASRFEELSTKQKEYSTALRAMERAGTGGGRMDRLMSMLNFVGNLGVVTEAAGRIYQYGAVTSNIQREMIRTQMGRVSGDVYRDVFGATQGDMAALRRVTSQQIEREARAAEDIARATNMAMGIRAAGGVMQAANAVGGVAVDAVRGAVTGTVVGGTMGAITGAIGGAAGGAARAAPVVTGAAVTAIDYTKRLTAGQNLVAMRQILRQQDLVRNMIEDRIQQQALNYARAGALTTRGIGAGRQGIHSMIMSEGFITGAAELGIAPEQIMEITATARDMLGGNLNAAELNQIVMRGGQLARAGIIQTPEQYARLRGQLAAVGGTDKELERLLTNAVATGMDNARNLNELVSLTRDQAAMSARIGLDATAGAADLLAMMNQNLQDRGVRPAMRQRILQESGRTLTRVFSNADINIGNILEASALRQRFQGLSVAEYTALQKLTPEQLLKMRQDIGFAKKLGLDRAIRTREDVEDLINISRFGASENLMSSFLFKDIRSLEEKERRGTINKEEQVKLERMRRLFSTLTGMDRSVLTGAEMDTSAIKRQAPPVKGRTVESEEVLRARAKGQATEVTTGFESIRDMYGSFAQMTEAMNKAAERLNPAAFSESLKESVDNYTVIANSFGSSVSEFSTAVDKFIDALSGGSDTVADKLKNLFNNVKRNTQSGVSRSSNPVIRSTYNRYPTMGD